MTPEKEAELFARFDLLLEIARRTEADIREIRAVVEENATRLARVEGRVEEQSKFLQCVLADRQPRGAAAE